MELDKFTAMKTYTAVFWDVAVVILNVVTTVLCNLLPEFSKRFKSTQTAPNRSLTHTKTCYYSNNMRIPYPY